jgi:FMN-dependent NADH-azoreductase
MRSTDMSSKILYVKASPSPHSRTTAVAEAFLNAHRAQHPQAEIDLVDVWSEPLPAFDNDMIDAKIAVLRRKDATEPQRRRWQEAVRLSQRFNAADKYVFSVPMWNFGLPYRLKHYIDVVTLAGENWIWTPDKGYEGFLRGKKAALVYSSAGDYPLAPVHADSDFQKPQMRRWLKFLGITDLVEINAAPALAPADKVGPALEAAQQHAAAQAAHF